MVDGAHYTLTLTRPDGQPTLVNIPIARVTTVLHTVFGASFGGAAYWGAKLATAHAVGADPDDPRTLAAYEKFKKSALSPNKVRDKAGDRGTNAHKVLELLVQGWSVEDIQEKLAWDGYCDGVVDFWTSLYVPEHQYHAEQSLVSLRMRVAGTTDLVEWDAIADWRVLFDLKTHKPASGNGGPAYEQELLQLDAYAMMHEEMGYGHIDQTVVVLASADGTYVIDDRQIERGSFEHVLNVYRSVEGACRG